MDNSVYNTTDNHLLAQWSCLHIQLHCDIVNWLLINLQIQWIIVMRGITGSCTVGLLGIFISLIVRLLTYTAGPIHRIPCTIVQGL